jgi:hypothetical protein
MARGVWRFQQPGDRLSPTWSHRHGSVVSDRTGTPKIYERRRDRTAHAGGDPYSDRPHGPAGQFSEIAQPTRNGPGSTSRSTASPPARAANHRRISGNEARLRAQPPHCVYIDAERQGAALHVDRDGNNLRDYPRGQ